MKKARRTKKTKSRLLYYFISALLLFTAATVSSFLFFKPKLAVKSPFIENIEPQSIEQSSDDKVINSLRLYESRKEDLSDYDELKRGSFLVIAEDTIKKHMGQYKVKLLDLYMDKHGIIYADFSGELRKGFKGDVAREYEIIAGLYDRISADVPNFRSLKILIDGKETESFGGHIDISKPIGDYIKGVSQRKTNRYF